MLTIKIGAFLTFARYVAESASAKLSPLAITILSNFSTFNFSFSLSAILVDVSYLSLPAILVFICFKFGSGSFFFAIKADIFSFILLM